MRENLNGLVFAAGVALVIAGVQVWSGAAALVVAGSLAIVVATRPYWPHKRR